MGGDDGVFRHGADGIEEVEIDVEWGSDEEGGAGTKAEDGGEESEEHESVEGGGKHGGEFGEWCAMSEEFRQLLWCAIAGEEFAHAGEAADHGDERDGGEEHANECECPRRLLGEEKIMQLCGE